MSEGDSPGWQGRGTQFGKGFEGSAEAFLAAPSTVAPFVAVNPYKNLAIWNQNFCKCFSAAVGGQILLLENGTLASQEQGHFGRCGFIGRWRGGGSSHFIIGLKPSPPLIPHHELHELGAPLVQKGTEAQSPSTNDHDGIFGYPRALCAPEIPSPGIALVRDIPHLQESDFEGRNKTEQ